MERIVSETEWKIIIRVFTNTDSTENKAFSFRLPEDKDMRIRFNKDWNI